MTDEKPKSDQDAVPGVVSIIMAQVQGVAIETRNLSRAIIIRHDCHRYILFHSYTLIVRHVDAHEPGTVGPLRTITQPAAAVER